MSTGTRLRARQDRELADKSADGGLVDGLDDAALGDDAGGVGGGGDVEGGAVDAGAVGGGAPAEAFGDFLGPLLSILGEEGGEAGLVKVVVAGESLGQPMVAHDDEGDAVCQ